jgi:hypothetical protein
MTEWIDFSVYALFIVALWFVWPAWSDRFTAAIVSDRNPEWAATHQEMVSRLERVWNPWVYYVWGGVSLSLLLAFQAGASPMGLISGTEHTPKWEALKDLNSTLLLPGLLYFVATGALFKRSLRRLVPLAERRRASLEPRTLDDFVPRACQLAAYGVAGSVLVAWLVVGILQLYSSSVFWERFVFLVVLTPAIAFLVRLGVHRRPGTLDRILGPGFRAREIRYGFLAHVMPPAAGAVRLYEEVTATPVMDVLRVLHLVVPAFIALWVFSLSSQTRRIAVTV